ncbi:flagellar basal body P-ring biosynthesis protein FlgA [mine drainage metagenome]|uniref:Flagellar basal body P-ring biosynthesis protein FlgA n=1 Tax=mine drainage metagenome TaxID=410659 RepID=A0A1J5Q1Y8_9ZZZZ
MKALVLLIALLPAGAMADTVIAARMLRPNTIIGPGDLSSLGETMPGTFAKVQDVVGKETRVILYAGRPIEPADIGPPALIKRNQIVALSFQRGSLSILTEGRSLGRGGVGDEIKVMNTSSHSTVTGTVDTDGTVIVQSEN